MELSEHTCLVGVKILSSRGLFHLRQLMRTLQAEDEIVHISSIYKVGVPEDQQSLRGQPSQGFFSLSLVLKMLTSREHLDYFQFLREVEEQWVEGVTRRATTLHLYLLTFDDVTLMTPELTLPYPELHSTPELLMPAAEISGDSIHPVLGKSLFSLTQAMRTQAWGEFYAQGKSLLDF